MLECSALPTTVPIAISYRPKANDYLPVVVAAIRRFLGDWPIVLLTQARHLPPPAWLEAWHVDTITDWAHSDNANKVLRLWEHQEIFGTAGAASGQNAAEQKAFQLACVVVGYARVFREFIHAFSQSGLSHSKADRQKSIAVCAARVEPATTAV